MAARTEHRPATGPAAAPARAVFAVGGMTCASCAARIEKKLNRIGGVSAAVNFATETPNRHLRSGGRHPRRPDRDVEATGYTARLPEPPARPGEPPAAGTPEPDEAASLRRRLTVSAVLTAPVVLLAMVPPLQFRFWQWLSLTLAAPVVLGAAGRSTPPPR